ncbi:MAG: LuxR C-terminal-related transcriptional regulator [Bacteroidota bacterium]|nr:LuxR C-terminal-related transcriptional regulator [Bacteroidota bacterium]
MFNKFCKMFSRPYSRFWLYFLLCISFLGCSAVPTGLKTAEQLMEKAPDSALHILQHINPHKLYTPSNKALYALLMSQALDRNDIKLESDSIITPATDYYTEKEPERAGYAWFYHARTAGNRGNANEQANNLLKAQAFAQLTENYKLRGLIYFDKAKMYESQKQFDSMIHYNKLSFRSFQLSNSPQNSVVSLINLGVGFLHDSRPDSAIRYYTSAGKLASMLHDTLLISTVDKSLGSAYYHQSLYMEALNYYRLAPLTHIGMYDSNKWYLMAEAYNQTGKLDSARIMLKRIKNTYEFAPQYYKLWQTIYEKEGNLKEALNTSIKITQVKDSLNDRKLAISFAGLDKKYKYQGLQLENQRLVINNKQRGLFLLFTLFVLSMLVVAVLIWRLNTKKKQFDVQNELLAKEKAFVEIEKDKVEKEKENSTLLEKQLKLQAILLLNIEQHRKNVFKQPGIWKNESEEMQPAQNNTFHKELIACMDLEYPDISLRLIKKFPTLSKRDILICCLLLAGFDTGMIATILDVKLESITKHRYRLRLKLQLQNSDNLVDYLRQF